MAETQATAGMETPYGTIADKCDLDRGGWFCAVHGVGFPNNMTMEGHAESPGMHTFAWFCHEHGLEVP